LRKAAFCTYLFIDIRYSLFTFVRCRSLLDVTWSQSSNVSKLRNNVLIYILFRDFSHVQQRMIWNLEVVLTTITLNDSHSDIILFSVCATVFCIF